MRWHGIFVELDEHYTRSVTDDEQVAEDALLEDVGGRCLV